MHAEYSELLRFISSPKSPFPHLKPTEAALAALLLLGLSRLDTLTSTLEQIREMLAAAGVAAVSS